MAKLIPECPFCGSGMLSVIRYWRPNRKMQVDTHMCSDCGTQYEPATMEIKPKGWALPNPNKKPAQVSLFDGIENMRELVDPVPKSVEGPNGAIVIVYRVHKDAPPGYAEEIKAMSEEFVQTKPVQRPDWWKYRKIKRRNK